MDRKLAQVVRAIFARALSTQDPEVREFLARRFADAVAWDDEYLEAWQQFEGWIACHGLELYVDLVEQSRSPRQEA